MPLAAQMVDGGASQVLDLDIRSGSLSGLHGSSVALGAEGRRVPLASRFATGVRALGNGSRVRLRVIAA